MGEWKRMDKLTITSHAFIQLIYWHYSVFPHSSNVWGFQTETTPRLSHEEAWASLSWLISSSPPPFLLSSLSQRNSTPSQGSPLSSCLCNHLCNHPSRILFGIHPAVVLTFPCFHPDPFHDLISFAKNMILSFLTFLFYLLSYNLISFFSFLILPQD